MTCGMFNVHNTITDAMCMESIHFRTRTRVARFFIYFQENFALFDLGNYNNHHEIFKESSGSFCNPISNYSKNKLRVIYYVKRYFHSDV